MNTDFRIQISLFTHPKFLKLHRQLGDAGTMALIRLFAYAAQNKPDGVLTNTDADDLALAAGFDGNAETFISTLVKVRFIEVRSDGVYCIHDWAEHNPWAVAAPARSEKAKNAANARWGDAKKTDEQSGKHASIVPDATNAMLNDTTSMQQASFSNAPLLSSPNLSSPNQERETREETERLSANADGLPGNPSGGELENTGGGDNPDATEDAPTEDATGNTEKKPTRPARTDPDALLKALFVAFRGGRYPHRTEEWAAKFPEGEFKSARSCLRSMASDGVTPEQMRQATDAAMRRFKEESMVTIPTINRHWTALLEPDPVPRGSPSSDLFSSTPAPVRRGNDLSLSELEQRNKQRIEEWTKQGLAIIQ